MSVLDSSHMQKTPVLMYKANADTITVEEVKCCGQSAKFVYYYNPVIKTRIDSERKTTQTTQWASSERKAWQWLENHFAGTLNQARKNEQTAMKQLGEIRRLIRKRFSDGQTMAFKATASDRS